MASEAKYAINTAVAAGENSYENFSLCAARLYWYGADNIPDGYCGSRTANGERVDCSAMTAAHRRLPFGKQVRVCHNGCVTVRINDRGPWVPGRDIDLTPAAARAIGLDGIGDVTISQL